MFGHHRHAVRVPFTRAELHGASVEFSILDGPHQVGEFAVRNEVKDRLVLGILGPVMAYPSKTKLRIRRDGFHITKPDAHRVQRAAAGAETSFTCLGMTHANPGWKPNHRSS